MKNTKKKSWLTALLISLALFCAIMYEVEGALTTEVSSNELTWNGTTATNNMPIDTGGWQRQTGGGFAIYSTADPFDGTVHIFIQDGAYGGTRERFFYTAPSNPTNFEQCIMSVKFNKADGGALALVTYFKDSGTYRGVGFYTVTSGSQWSYYDGGFSSSGAWLDEGYQQLILNISGTDLHAFKKNATATELIKIFGSVDVINNIGIEVDDSNPTDFKIDNITCGNYTDFAFVPPPPPPPDNITIHSPPNNTLNRSNPLAFIYEHSFNASFCGLYSNITGDFLLISNLSQGTSNQSIEENITEYFLNLSDKHAVYRFEDNETAYAVDLVAGNNATINGNSYVSSKGGNETGNFALDFAVTYLNAPTQSWMDYGTTNDFTISAWFRSDHASDGDYHMIVDTRDAGSDGIFLAIASDDTIQLVVNTVTISTNYTVTNNNWHFVTAVVNRDDDSETSIYVDGIDESGGSVTNTEFVNVNSDLYIGRRSFSAGIYWEGDLDEVMFWNRALDYGNVTRLYNQGINFSRIVTNITEIITNITLNNSINYTLNHTLPEDTEENILYYIECHNSSDLINSTILTIPYNNDFTSPTIDIIFPDENNRSWNDNLNISISLNDKSTCEINDTAFSLTFSNDTFYTWSETTLDNRPYQFYINCTDDGFNPANVTINMTKDKFFPIITMVAPLENGTEIENLNNYEFIFNAFDDSEIYDINISIVENGSFDECFAEDIFVTGTPIYNYSETLNLENCTNNTKLLIIKVCDTHTKNEIKDADSIIKDKKNIKFKFGDTNIHIKALDGSFATSTNKLKDRYTFTFEYSETLNVKQFELKANKEIIYLPNSEHKGHFIIGNHWIDFNQIGDVIVDIVDDNGTLKYYITVDNDADNITFESVGELNCKEAHTSFQLVSERGAYNINLINDLNLFNSDILNLTTTAGVLLFIFLFIVLIVLVILTEHFRVAALYFVTAMYGFFYALLLYVSLSAVLGFILFALSMLYIVLGFAVAKE